MEDIQIDEDQSVQIGLTVIDGDSDLDALLFSATSDNSQLVPTDRMTFSGTGSTRLLTIQPLPNQHGQARITVQVTDELGNLDSTEFLFTVRSINDTPWISEILDHSIRMDVSIDELRFQIQDPETASNRLKLQVESSNPGLLSEEGIQIRGEGSYRSFSIQPNPGQCGHATITFRVEDEQGATTTTQFELNVLCNDQMLFEFGTAEGIKDSEVTVPLIVSRFDRMQGFQFSVHWDPGIAEFVGIEDIQLPGMDLEDFGTAQSGQGTLTVSWSHEDVEFNPLSLADGSVLFNMRFRLVGERGTGTNLSITNSPTPIEAIQVRNDQLVLTTLHPQPGFIHILNLVQIGGRVTYGSESELAVIPGVEVILKGSESERTTHTDENGNFDFDGVEGGKNYVLKTGRFEDSQANRKISTLDLLKIQSHILYKSRLTSPFSVIAADASGNQQVTTLDIIVMRRLILGLADYYLNSDTTLSDLWIFVPSSVHFIDPTLPWKDLLYEYEYSEVSDDLGNQNFIGVKYGDANLDWVSSQTMTPATSLPGTPAFQTFLAQPEPLEVRLKIEKQAAWRAGRIAVPVVVESFEGVTSLQFSLRWNPNQLKFIQTANPGLPNLFSENFGVHRIENGLLTFCWHDIELQGVDLPRGTELFQLEFEVLGKPGDLSFIEFTDLPTSQEATYFMHSRQVQCMNGWVEISGDSGAITDFPVIRQSASERLWMIQTYSGQEYILETTGSLKDPVWIPVDRFFGDGNPIHLPTEKGDLNALFYRLRTVVPSPNY